MRRNYAVFFMITCFLANLSWAQEPYQLTLAQALQLAYKQNPSVIEARKAIIAAQGGKITESSFINPELGLELGDQNELSIKQTFHPIGVRGLKGKIAKNEISIKEQALRSTWAEAYVKVREAYSSVLLNQKELELQKANLKSLRQFFSNVQLRYAGGQVLKNQFQRAKIELLKTEGEYLKADNQFNIAKSYLNLLLGRPRDTSVEIKDSLKEEALKIDLERLTQMALESPEVKAHELELDSKNKLVYKEQLTRLPSYSLGLKRTEGTEEEGDDYAALIEFSIPIWNLNQGEVKKAIAERDMQKTRMEAFKQAVDFEVYKLYSQAQLEQKQLNLYKRSLDESHEMFRLASLRFKEGEINFMEYLDQVKSSLDSRVEYYRGLFALSHSISTLEKAVHSSLRGEEYLK